MNVVKRLAQSVLKRLGLRVQRLSSVIEQQYLEQQRQQQYLEQQKRQNETKVLWLKQLEIKTIFDIGANTGQFAQAISEIFPDSIIYSFEPLQDCYEELIENFQCYQNFQAFNIALSDAVEDARIYRNQYSPSSSLLPMKNIHKEIFPQTSFEVVETVKTTRLDDIAKNLIIDDPILIKIDVQGFENRVISGGVNLIRRAKLVIVEMSLEPLYEGQPLFDDIYQTLTKLGFQYRGNYEQLYNPQDGRVLQVDGIFMKRSTQA